MAYSLLSLPALRSTRRSLVTHVATEILEDRIVLSAAAIAPPVVPAVDASMVTITDIAVNEVEVTGENELTALATVTGTALGSAFTQDVEIPILVDATKAEGTETCDVLNVSVGPVNLDVLGLVVNLDDCEGGPVTIDITGEEGEGNLLGNLVCGIAGLLDADGGLEGLSSADSATLTTGLTDILNGSDASPGLLDQFLTEAETVEGMDSGNRVTDILTLELPEGLHVDLLGLKVDTSGICLNVTAEEGSGNLLGNLLGSLSGLLDRVDDVDGPLEDLGNSLTEFVDGLKTRLGELDEIPEGLSESIDQLAKDLRGLDRLVDRLERTGQISDDRLERLVTRFSDRIGEVTERLGAAEGDQLARLVDRVGNIVDRFEDRLKEAAKGNHGGDDDDDDDDESGGINDDRLEEIVNRFADRIDRIIDRLSERDDDRFEDVIDRLGDFVDRLEDRLGDIAGGDDDDEDSRAELLAHDDVMNRLLVGA